MPSGTSMRRGRVMPDPGPRATSLAPSRRASLQDLTPVGMQDLTLVVRMVLDAGVLGAGVGRGAVALRRGWVARDVGGASADGVLHACGRVGDVPGAGR